MFELIFLFTLGLIWIIFAVVQDIRKREIANWLNFSLIIFALGFRFFYSLFYENNFSFFVQGLVGFGVFLILGNLFYYSRLFAGGDSKLMIALGPILPVFINSYSNLKFFLFFILIFLLIGFFYTIFFILYFGIKNFKKFKPEFIIQFKKNKKYIIPITFFSILFLIAGFFEIFCFYFAIYVIFLLYFIIIAKSIDESCMIKKIKTIELTEGDWLYKNVKIGRKLIKTSWGGLNNKEIQILRKNKKEILIRQGVPFAPVFLISYLFVFFLLKSGVFNLLFKIF